MNLRIPIALLALSTLAFGCSDPADPVQQGQLCVPSTDACPDAISVERSSVGRNTLDYSILHRGTQDSTATFRVTTIGQSLDDDLTIPDERGETEDGRIILYEQEYTLGAGETVHQALTAFDLTVTRRLQLELLCDAGQCDHVVDYIFFSESIECVDNDSCSRNEFCEVVYGRCSECLTDIQCEGDQGCDRETGFCTAGASTGCQQTSSLGAPTGWLLAALLLILLATTIRSSPSPRPWLSAMFLSAMLLAIPVAEAQANRGASMNAGGGLRVLTGEAGDLVYPGWGIKVSQEVHWHNLGFHFQLSNHSLRMRDDVRPSGESRPITGYGVSLGLRYHYRLPIDLATLGQDRPFELLGGLDYTRLSFAENRLAPVTGLDLNYHALGPTLGLRWAWGSLELTGLANLSQIFDWPGQLLSFDLTIGLNL